MKILLLCYEYPPIGGGGGIGAQQYAEAWVAGGHRVTVVTSRCAGLAAEEIINGVSVLRVLTIGRNDRATSSFLSMLCYNVTGLLHVMLHRQELKDFDVINTHFSIPTGPVAQVASRLLRLPNVLTIIGGDIYDPSKKSSPHRSAFFRLVNHWIINAADRVIAISSDTKKRAEQYYRVCRPIQVINYGFKPAIHARQNDIDFPIRRGKFYLIAVGRLVERKGFDVLIRALRYLPEEIDMLLVGDGPLDAGLRTMAREMKVEQRVHMLGYKKREEIYSLLRKSHCFVLSSMHEGLGIVVQEAMDAGLPVVCTNNGGQVDLIQQGRNGLLVNIGDHKALADAIQTVYRDRNLAEAMRRNNLADVRSLCIENNSKLYLELFHEVTGHREVQTVSVHKENGTELIGAGKQGV